MPGFRYGPREDDQLVPKRADTGIFDYLGAVAYDGLYHMPVPAAYRWSNLELSKGPEEYEDDVIAPEEAKRKYGLDGELQFSEPIAEGAARLLYDRKIAELRREYLLTSGSEDHWGRKLTGFGVSMASQIVDPVNLASMFVPVVGESRAFQGASRASSFFSRGLISAKTLAKYTGTDPLRFRLAKGGLEGLVGTVMVEPLVALPAKAEQSHYGWDDSAMNLIFGTVLGAGFHALGGVLHDKLGWFGGEARRLDPQSHEAAVMAAVRDIVSDEPVFSPVDIIRTDPHVIQEELKWDAKKARQEAMGELGVTEPVRLEPVEFKEETFTAIDQKLKTLQENFQGDDLSPWELIEKKDFKKLIRAVFKAGYDITDAEIRMGGESIVFITKDKVIKIADFENADPANLIPGVVLHPEVTKSLGHQNIEVYARADTAKFDNELKDAWLNYHSAYELFGAKHGYSFDDVHSGNLGEINGEVFLIDRGKIRASDKTPGYFEALLKNANPETKRLYQQLEDQYALAQAIKDPATIRAEQEKAVKALIAKKKRDFQKQKPVHESDPQVKSEPEELVPNDLEGRKEAEADLQTEITQLEKELMEEFERENPEAEKKKSMTPDADELIEKAKVLGNAVKEGAACMAQKIL